VLRTHSNHISDWRRGLHASYEHEVLPLHIQIGPVQIEPVTRRLLRVLAGCDQPTVLDAIRRAGGSLDGTRRCYWVEAVRLRQLETELRANADLFRLP
jgi:hypothetical protein